MSINRNRFNKRYRLGLLNAMANWLDDLRWKWDYHRDAILGTLAACAFAVLIAGYLAYGLVCN